MGSNSKTVLQLKGFDDLIAEIQRAGGSVDNAVVKAMNESVNVVEQQLQSECARVGVPSTVSGEIKVEAPKMTHDVCAGAVGWKLGAYDPQNPSAGYKAVLLNYGTIRRKTKTGADRGAIKARGFITNAKKKSKKQVAAIQKKTFDEILKGLKIK